MKKRILLLVLSMFMIATVYSASITVSKPNGGTFAKNKSLLIVWTASGISGNVKINIRKADGSGGAVIHASYPVNKSSYSHSLASVIPGKYFIKIKQGKVFGKSKVFTVSNKIDTKPYIRILTPKGGVFYNDKDKLNITWDYEGVRGLAKINLRKVDGSGGIVLYNAFQIANTRFKYKLKNIPVGKYFIKIKQGKVFGKSADITILNKTSTNNNGIKIIKELPRINTIVTVDEKHRIKQPVLGFNKKPEIKNDAYGELIPSSDLIDYGSSMVLKILYKNASRVEVWNKTTNTLEFVTGYKGSPNLSTNTASITLKLSSIKTKFEINVWGKGSSYIGNIWVYTRPIVNEFKIVQTPRYYQEVQYSFSGCEYAYLKKYDEKKNQWIRVFRLAGDAHTKYGQYPKKGKIILASVSSKKTRYALFLIGESKQGVVKSKELVKNFWTDQFTK